MNHSHSQIYPGGMIHKQRVLDYQECYNLAELFSLLEIKSTTYGKVYNDRKDKITVNKIPKLLKQYVKLALSRLESKLKPNFVKVTRYRNKKHIKPMVDPHYFGDDTVMMLIGDTTTFSMVNLKNAKATMETAFYNGSCIALSKESRYLWYYDTKPTMGLRWIITMGRLDVEKMEKGIERRKHSHNLNHNHIDKETD